MQDLSVHLRRTFSFASILFCCRVGFFSLAATSEVNNSVSSSAAKKRKDAMLAVVGAAGCKALTVWLCLWCI